MEEEIFALIPSLKGRAKKSVRILPRQGAEPAVDATKLGGVFLWSDEEPWFYCELTEEALPGDFGSSEWRLADDIGVAFGDPQHNDAFAPVLQIRAEDVSLMRFPPGTNVFQLLWCPRYHLSNYAPVCRIAWRTERSVVKQLEPMPVPGFPDHNLLPDPSPVLLREVVEYPAYSALSQEERNLLDDAERWKFYFDNLSPHSGIKIGGHPDWIQNPEIPVCACGSEMEHLLTIGSDVFEDYPDHKAPGLCIGDAGSVYVFICYECENLPFNSVFQCS